MINYFQPGPIPKACRRRSVNEHRRAEQERDEHYPGDHASCDGSSLSLSLRLVGGKEARVKRCKENNKCVHVPVYPNTSLLMQSLCFILSS